MTNPRGADVRKGRAIRNCSASCARAPLDGIGNPCTRLRGHAGPCAHPPAMPIIAEVSSWADRMRADLTTEVNVRDMILARVVTGGEWTAEERAMQALLRILDHERQQVRILGGIATDWRAAARMKDGRPIKITQPKKSGARGKRK